MYMVSNMVMLCLYVYGQQYGQLNIVINYASCFVLFCNLKKKIGKIYVAAVFNYVS